LLKEYQKTTRNLLFAGYLIVVAGSYHLSFWLTGILSEAVTYYKADFIIAAILTWGAILWNSKACYLFRSKSNLDVLRPIVSASLKASALYLVYLYFIRFPIEYQFQTALFFGLSFVGLNLLQLLIKNVLQNVRTRGFNYQSVIILGKGRRAKKFADKILTNSNWGFKITGFIEPNKAKTGNAAPWLWSYSDIPQIGCIEDLPAVLKSFQVDWLVIALDNPNSLAAESLALKCQEMGVHLVVLPEIYPTAFSTVRSTEFFGSPVLVYETGPAGSQRLYLKEIYDRVGAFLGLISTLPILFISALLIKLFSKGPIFYAQERLGKNGKKFVMYKFRTMVIDADKRKQKLDSLNEMDGPVFKIKNDPRVTPIGKVLRNMSIDELPQLFNVLKGDMSLVGPRPALLDEVKQYDSWQRRRLSIKPGITCLWQIGGRNSINFENWMRLDLEYIDNWSLWLDTKILAKTIPAVLSRKGAS